MPSTQKDINGLIRTLKKQGWRVVHGGKHYKAYPPDRRFPMATLPVSPSDWRAWDNMVASLRRRGAAV